MAGYRILNSGDPNRIVMERGTGFRPFLAGTGLIIGIGWTIIAAAGLAGDAKELFRTSVVIGIPIGLTIVSLLALTGRRGPGRLIFDGQSGRLKADEAGRRGVDER